MKKENFRNIAVLLATSYVLVGCANNNQNNDYENKQIIPTEIVEETNTETEMSTEPEIPVEVETETEKQTVEEVMTDEEVVEYINKVGDEINNCTDGITKNAKEGFMTVVDFLFYGGEIGGRNFDSLKEDTKVKVLEIYDSVSIYLDEKLPIWQQSLGEKYEKAKLMWDENKGTLFDIYESGKQKLKNWYDSFRQENQN